MEINAVPKLHTGVPFLDGMIDCSIRNEPFGNSSGDDLKDKIQFSGSIIIPDGINHDRTNVLIKGSPGSGKTVLACQIALNLANDVFFHQKASPPQNARNLETSVSFDTEYQMSYSERDKFRPIVPILFTFGHRKNELKYLIDEIFIRPTGCSTDPECMEILSEDEENPSFVPDAAVIARLRESGIKDQKSLSAHYPIIVSLEGDDPRTALHVDDINRCLADIQNRIEALRDDVGNDSMNKNRKDEAKWTRYFKDFKTNLRLDNPKFNFSLSKSNLRQCIERIWNISEAIPKSNERVTYAVFIDSVNDLFPDFNDRATLHKLFGLSRSFRTVFFHLLEDYSFTGKAEYLYLAKALEFESDIVIDLSHENVPYYRSYIEIAKSRYSSRVKGRQLYKISARPSCVGSPNKDDEATDNSMRGVNNCVGFQIYLSIHNRFTTSRSIPGAITQAEKNWVTTGLDYLDRIVSSTDNGKDRKIIPPNSFILIQGPMGGHKLALAFNILMGSFKDAAELPAKPKKNVMIVSFRDELSTDMKRIASIADDSCTTFKIEPSKPNNGRTGANNKININAFDIKGKTAENESTDFGNLIEVTFRPGYLTLEEFLFAFEHLIATRQPERVLFDNTDLIKMRFAELSRDATLLAAALRYLKAHSILSVIIDVVEKGSDETLSYGLRGMADYVIQTEPIESFVTGSVEYKLSGKPLVDKEFIKVGPIPVIKGGLMSKFHFGSKLMENNKPKLNPENLKIAVMSISNPRNKVYSQNFIALTAISKDSLSCDPTKKNYMDLPENLLLLGSIETVRQGKKK